MALASQRPNPSLAAFSFGFFIFANTCLAQVSAEPVPRFNRDIRPILSESCFQCHGPDDKKRSGGLRLDTFEGATQVLKSGKPAIVPGKPEASDLFARIASHDPDEVMPPPKSKRPTITPAQTATLTRWVAAGAPYEGHWAFQPLAQSSPPDVKEANWCKNDLDRFILDKLEAESLTPSPSASPEVLLRRLSLDLVGLLPTPEEVMAFTAAYSQNPQTAVEAAADRLLASPHYGERWGRHWLDQARYADSDGYARDDFRVMWPYRDWVISALNADLPFDQFSIEQLAGDLLPNATKAQKVASAFHRNTLINTEGGSDPEQFRVEAVMDRVNTTGAVWLGLTIGCAQCHTHKYDPITQKEYYQLYAFFNQGADVNRRGPVVTVTKGEMFGGPAVIEDSGLGASAIEEARAQWEESEIERLKAIGNESLKPKEAQHLDDLLMDPAARTNEQKARLEKMYSFFRPNDTRMGKGKRPTSDDPEASTVEQMVMQDVSKPRKTYLFQRGDFTRPDEAGGEIAPGIIASIHQSMGMPMPEFKNRLDLAKWLVAPTNPLTPRVTLNRLWMKYFGRGLVETEEDFGMQGSAPTHPELLDWLSREFINGGWKMKRIHRLIVTSATYQQSSHARAELTAKDPLNLLLGRQERLRLEAEIIRDAALCASGLLHAEIGGPGFRPPQPDGVYAFTQAAKPWRPSPAPERYRRGLYTIFFRSAAHPLFSTFDMPNMQTTCTRRIRSNTPLQSLMMANDPVFIELAQGFAKRLLSSASNQDERLKLAVRLGLCREAEAQEFEILRRYYLQQVEQFEKNPSSMTGLLPTANKASLAREAAMVSVCRVIFNMDNFITRE